MKNTWDVYILYPLIVIALLVGYYFLIKKSNLVTKKRGLLTNLLQIFLLWFALTFMSDTNFGVMGFFEKYNFTIVQTSTIIFLTTGTLYCALIFLPLQSIKFLRTNKGLKITNMVIYATLIFIVILGMFIAHMSIAIIMIILIGAGISLRSNNYLYFNKNYTKQLYPFRTVAFIAPLISLAIFSSITSLNVIKEASINIPVEWQNFIILLFALIVLLCSFGLYIFYGSQEDTHDDFEEAELSVLEKFSWKKVIIMYVLAVLVVLFKEIMQSNFMQFYIGQFFYNDNQNGLFIDQILRFNSFLFIIPEIFLSFFACTWLFKKIGVKYTFGSGLVIAMFAFAIGAMIDNKYVFFLVQFLATCGFTLCISGIIALCLDWQIRAGHKKPVFNLLLIVIYGTQAIFKIVTMLMEYRGVGIFRFKDATVNYSENLSIIHTLYDVFSILMLVAFIVTLSAAVIWFYLGTYVVAEYLNYHKEMLPKINNVLKNSFLKKVKSKIVVKE